MTATKQPLILVDVIKFYCLLVRWAMAYFSHNQCDNKNQPSVLFFNKRELSKNTKDLSGTNPGEPSTRPPSCTPPKQPLYLNNIRSC